MSNTTELKKTALNKVMTDIGGKMVDFHGWQLPMQFEGIIKEYKEVRNACGIFDVSHMGNIFIEGKDAYNLVQKINSNNVTPQEGRGVYSHILNEEGAIIDDVIAFCLNKEKFYIVVNATTSEKDYNWFQKNAEGMDVVITNESANLQMIALQGPKSLALMQDICPAALELKRFNILQTKLFDADILISRTGYTGEDGFELAADSETIIKIFNYFVKQGAVPCGLGARDILRLEAGYLLYGSDIDENHTPYEASYGWVVKLKKDTDFIGKAALAKQKADGVKTKLTGFVLTERGVARSGSKILAGGSEIGTLTSATFSPSLNTSIGMGYVPADLDENSQVEIVVGSRTFTAKISKMPFYDNKV